MGSSKGLSQSMPIEMIEATDHHRRHQPHTDQVKWLPSNGDSNGSDTIRRLGLQSYDNSGDASATMFTW